MALTFIQKSIPNPTTTVNYPQNTVIYDDTNNGGLELKNTASLSADSNVTDQCWDVHMSNYELLSVFVPFNHSFNYDNVNASWSSSTSWILDDITLLDNLNPCKIKFKYKCPYDIKLHINMYPSLVDAEAYTEGSFYGQYDLPLSSVWTEYTLNLTTLLPDNYDPEEYPWLLGDIAVAGMSTIQIFFINPEHHICDFSIKDISYEYSYLSAGAYFIGDDYKELTVEGPKCYSKTYSFFVNSVDTWTIPKYQRTTSDIGPNPPYTNTLLSISPMTGGPGITPITITTNPTWPPSTTTREGRYDIVFQHESGLIEYLIFFYSPSTSFSMGIGSDGVLVQGTITINIPLNGGSHTDTWSYCDPTLTWVADLYNLPAGYSFSGQTSGVNGEFIQTITLPSSNNCFSTVYNYSIHALTPSIADRHFELIQPGTGIQPTYDKSVINHNYSMVGTDTVTITTVAHDIAWKPIESCDWFNVSVTSDDTVTDWNNDTYYTGNGTITINYLSDNPNSTLRTENLTIKNYHLNKGVDVTYENHLIYYLCADENIDDKVIVVNQLGQSIIAPSNLQANAISTTSINLTWTDGSSNETGFEIFRNGSSIATVGSNVTSFTDTSLSPSTNYCYQVRSFNASEQSSLSNSACATTWQVINTPQNLVATATSSSSVSLTWSDVSNDLGYEVFRNDVMVGSTSTNMTTYVDNGLTELTQYCYKVRAYNGANKSNFSNTSCVTTPSSFNIWNNLDGYYRLEEPSGTVYTAIGTSNGTVYGAPSRNQIGKSLYSYLFSGYQAIDLGYNTYRFTTDFTVSVWFNCTTAANGNLFSRYSSVSGCRCYSMGVTANRQIHFDVYNTSNVQYRAITGNYIFNLNTWNHVVFIKRGTTMKIFLNNSVVATHNSAPTTIKNTTGTTSNYLKTFIAACARSSAVPDAFFKGYVDEVAIWNIGHQDTVVPMLWNNGNGIFY